MWEVSHAWAQGDNADLVLWCNWKHLGIWIREPWFEPRRDQCPRQGMLSPLYGGAAVERLTALCQSGLIVTHLQPVGAQCEGMIPSGARVRIPSGSFVMSSKDPAEVSRDRYRNGFDKISWSNTPRPVYHGGIRVAAVPPVGQVIEIKPANQIIVVESK